MAEALRLSEAPRIDLSEARDEFDRGRAIFVDVRSREDYDRSHVPGAVFMPLKDVFRRVEELPRDRLIIFY